MKMHALIVLYLVLLHIQCTVKITMLWSIKKLDIVNIVIFRLLQRYFVNKISMIGNFTYLHKYLNCHIQKLALTRLGP